MAYYIHRERYISDIVPPKSIIKFPTLVSESLNRSAFLNIPPYNNMEEGEWQATVVHDVFYNGCTLSPQTQTEEECDNYRSSLFDGTFDINLPGVYLISWYVSQMTGLVPDGCFFKIKYYNDAQQCWEAPSVGSRLLVSSSEFSTVVYISKDQFPEPDGGKVTLALFNESDEPLFMNRTPELKAGLSIFGFNPVNEEQITEAWDYIEELTENCCGMGRDGAHVLACIKWQLTKLEVIEKDQDAQLDQLEIDWREFYDRFLTHTDGGREVTKVPVIFGARNGVLISEEVGLQLRYIRVGYIYHFWLAGRNNGTKARSGRTWITPTTWTNPNPPYEERLLLPFLQFFDRPIPIVGSLTMLTNMGTGYGSYNYTFRYPLYVDRDGIYLEYEEPDKAPMNFPDLAYLSFSIPVILNVIEDGG